MKVTGCFLKLVTLGGAATILLLRFMLPEKGQDLQDELDVALLAPPGGKNRDRMYRINWKKIKECSVRKPGNIQGWRYAG